MQMPELGFVPSTSYDDALNRAAEESGVDREYWDIFGNYHRLPLEAQRSLLSSLGWDTTTAETLDRERERRFRSYVDAPVPRTVVLRESQKAVNLTLPAGTTVSIFFELTLESGGQIAGTAHTLQLNPIRDVVLKDSRWRTYTLPLPEEAPIGYHQLKISIDGISRGTSNVIICPDRAYLPAPLANGARSAGFNVTLYGLRSNRNWGCGDFTDLRALIDWAHETGFSCIGLNPLHAIRNRSPYNTSPYLPLSIFYKNWIYLDIESVPEFALCAAAQRLFRSQRVEKTIQRLRGSDLVEYHEVDRLKRRFLNLLFGRFRRARRTDPARARAFENYVEREGDLLHGFALYCVLDEFLHEEDPTRWTWRDWPLEYQDPSSEACRAFAEQHASAVELHKYIQFLIHEQLSAVQAHARLRGMSIGLYHDLALATDNCGADLWAHREFFVDGCRVGSPPDDFSPTGQDWGFPPPRAVAHWENGYRLFRESIRKIVQYGGALRIDHVMRLFRLFWVPNGLAAAAGTYVRDNALDLLRILALESVRSKSIIVGEDLGTITDEIRDGLARFGILSYRLFYFEKNAHDGSFKRSYEYPRQALVASTTHDLPTLAGFWTAREIETRKQACLLDENANQNQLHDRNRERQRMLDVLHAENLLPADFARDVADVAELDDILRQAIIAFLAQTPSMILLLNQEDLTKETNQQNLPSTTGEYPNWQRKMKITIEDLRSAELRPYSQMIRDQLLRTARATIPDT